MQRDLPYVRLALYTARSVGQWQLNPIRNANVKDIICDICVPYMWHVWHMVLYKLS